MSSAPGKKARHAFAPRLRREQWVVFGQGRALCDALVKYRPWLGREAERMWPGEEEKVDQAVRRGLRWLEVVDVRRFDDRDHAWIEAQLCQVILRAA